MRNPQALQITCINSNAPHVSTASCVIISPELKESQFAAPTQVPLPQSPDNFAAARSGASHCDHR
jgi:hypothetical protein